MSNEKGPDHSRRKERSRQAILAATRALIRSGAIGPNESVVVCITGNGYKTAEVMQDRVAKPTQIGRGIADFEKALVSQLGDLTLAR